MPQLLLYAAKVLGADHLFAWIQLIWKITALASHNLIERQDNVVTILDTKLG